MKVYAILSGRKNRQITESWPECFKLVNKYSGAVYKSFPTWLEAANYLGYKLDPNKDYIYNDIYMNFATALIDAISKMKYSIVCF